LKDEHACGIILKQMWRELNAKIRVCSVASAVVMVSIFRLLGKNTMVTPISVVITFTHVCVDSLCQLEQIDIHNTCNSRKHLLRPLDNNMVYQDIIWTSEWGSNRRAERITHWEASSNRILDDEIEDEIGGAYST
jgi:hypothetical protein